MYKHWIFFLVRLKVLIFEINKFLYVYLFPQLKIKIISLSLSKRNKKLQLYDLSLLSNMKISIKIGQTMNIMSLRYLTHSGQ